MSLLERLEQNKSTVADNSDSAKTQKVVDAFVEVKEKIHNEVIDKINKNGESEITETFVKKLIEDSLEINLDNVPRSDRARIACEIYYDIMGYGPLEELLLDPSVTEIMVNGPDRIYIEKNGRIELSSTKFRDNTHVLNIIDRIVSSIGRHIDEASPMVDARLADGSRVNAVIPPISLVGPVITIRKFSKKPFNAQNLIEFGSLSPKMMAFLEACVKGKLNIIVSGGTGSGKTTLLNVLSSFIPTNERIVTIEDAAEIKLEQDHVITLEARPSNLEGKGLISIRHLVVNALRMRPDRIIVGEVRSGESLDMLQAMNTGHDGSLTTTHANSPRDSIARIETMVMMAGMELPLKAIREQIVSAIDIIVQQSRLRDGSRKITAISEVVGMEGDIVTMHDVFTYKTDGQLDNRGKFKGTFSPTGVRPICLEKIKENGVAINDDWFKL